jgi:hypothetical protein
MIKDVIIHYFWRIGSPNISRFLKPLSLWIVAEFVLEGNYSQVCKARQEQEN